MTRTIQGKICDTSNRLCHGTMSVREQKERGKEDLIRRLQSRSLVKEAPVQKHNLRGVAQARFGGGAGS